MAVSKAEQAVEENIVTLDRRRSDRRVEQAATGEAAGGQPTRRKKQRRRHIDPTTCERDYSEQEIEFMRAMDDYKRDSGRMFPTCSEVLEVIRALGYFQLSDEQIEVLGIAAAPESYAGEASQDDAESLEEELVG